MTTQVNGRTSASAQAPEERTREEIARARRERQEAIAGEYERLMDIAWAHHHAASAAMLAAKHAHGIDDDVRRDLAHEAIDSIDLARSWLGHAVGTLNRNEPPF